MTTDDFATRGYMRTLVIRVCSDCQHALGFHYPNAGCMESGCDCALTDIYFFKHPRAWHYGATTKGDTQ